MSAWHRALAAARGFGSPPAAWVLPSGFRGEALPGGESLIMAAPPVGLADVGRGESRLRAEVAALGARWELRTVNEMRAELGMRPVERDGPHVHDWANLPGGERACRCGETEARE